MAKPATVKIKLVSTAETGFYYVTKKNPRNMTEKLSLKKYDPVVRKHVDFKEAKIIIRRRCRRLLVLLTSGVSPARLPLLRAPL